MKHVAPSSYLLPAAVFLAAVLGLSLSVALPYALAPSEYARFSLTLSLAQLISSIGFEWSRVSVVRYGGQNDDRAGSRMGTLLAFYVVAALTLASAGIAFAASTFWLSGTALIAMTCFVAAIQGSFDGRSALARARFDNAILAASMVMRPALGLILIIALGRLTHSATGALAGLVLSYFFTFPIFRAGPKNKWQVGKFAREDALPLFRFGFTAAIGTNISLAVPAALRSIIVAVLGVSGAGGTLLALDIGQRVFSTIGIALNLLHLQTLIKTIDTGGEDVAIARARYSITIEAAIYAFLVAVLTAASEPVGRIIAPKSFELDFIRHLPMMALLMAGLSLRQYAIEPLFIAFKRVRFLALGPVLTLALVGLAWLAITAGLVAPKMLLVLLIAASAAGFAMPLFVLHRLFPGCVPVLAIVGFGGAAWLAVLATPQFDVSSPLLAMIVRAGVCAITYVVLAGTLILLGRLIGRRSAASAGSARFTEQMEN